MTNQPSPWQRFRDTFIQAAVHSPLGGGGLARLGLKTFRHATDDQINQAIKSLDDDFAKKYKDAPIAQHVRKGHPLDYAAPDNIGRGVVSLLGHILGGVDPTYAIAPGASALERIPAQAAVQGAASAVRQKVNVNTGMQDKIHPEDILTDMATGAVFQGGFEGVHAAARSIHSVRPPETLTSEHMTPEGQRQSLVSPTSDVAPLAPDGLPGNGSVRPIDPEMIAKIMGNHEPLPVEDRRLNSRAVPDTLGPDDILNDLPPANQEFLKSQPDNVEPLAPARSPSGLFRETKRDPDGSVYLEYQPSADKAPIPIKMGIDNGVAEMAIDQFSTQANRLGPTKIREAMHDLMGMYPEITKFGGFRRSGAGKGRVQEITPPNKDNVVEFPQNEATPNYDSLTPAEANSLLYPTEQRHQFSGVPDNELPAHALETTPQEQQGYDAAASTVPVDNTGYEAHTPNIETPVAANDATRMDAVKQLIPSILKDERGSLGYKDEGGNPETPPFIQKLYDALNTGKKARTKQNELYSAERSKRVKELVKARKATSGVEGFYAEKAKLKGQLPTAEYAGLTGLEQQDIEDLFNHVKNHPNLGYLQSITARDGLSKMLQGEVPTKTEMALLSRTLPPEVVKKMMQSRGWLGKAFDATANVLNVPKALMASYDISAPLRQGAFMVGRKQFYTSLAPMVKAFVSPKAEAAVRENIYRDPLFAAMQDAGLAVPVYKGHNGGPALAEHEEPYMTNLAQRIPLVGIGVRASERAYNTFVYKLRADTFKTIYHAGKAGGKQWNQDSLKDLAKFINTFTGRGDLGKFNNAAPILNSALFSPKLLKSRIDAINPKFYKDLDPYVRKEAIKSIMSFAVIAGSVMGLAHLAGAEVGADPRQADGWKIKVGNTRYDILGGEQQLIRLLGNVGTYGKRKAVEVASTGKIKLSHNERTATDNVGQFLRNKESPDVSLAHDFMSGKTAVGDDFDAKAAVASRVTPLVAQDAYDAAKDLEAQGVPVNEAIIKGVIKASPGLLGVGASTYQKKEKKSKGEFSSSEFSQEFKSSKEFGKEF